MPSVDRGEAPTYEDDRTPDIGIWQSQGRSNWVWLVPMPSRALAIEIAPNDSPLPGALTRHFDRVDRTGADGLGRLSVNDGTASCVALHEARPFLESATASQLLEKCFRVIAPGGWLYISLSNPSWVGARHASPVRWARSLVLDTIAPESSRLTSARRIRTRVLDAGFGEVRRYFVTPSLFAPDALIPATRGAVIAHGPFLRTGKTARTVRSAIASAGGYAGLYPAEILLCRK